MCARDLAAALDRLATRPGSAGAVSRDRGAVLALYERVFEHRTFTGRSGRMYAYEGIGCVYWHMVAKLLLATQEAAFAAARAGAPEPVRQGLARAYARIRAGLGTHRSVEEYGAFPTDPYSHTPLHAGAQQPGMTGQVKEEILARFGELGVIVREGRIAFSPVLLRQDEFLRAPATFEHVDAAGRPATLELPAGSLAFTFCQVPVVYHRVSGAGWIRLTRAGGQVREIPGAALDGEASAALLARCGGVTRVDVGVPEQALLVD